MYALEPLHEGWSEDGISNGSITVVQDKSGQYDLIIKHSGGTLTARADGAVLAPIEKQPGRFTIIAVYPLGTVETYQFTLDRAGNGTLLLARMKNAVPPYRLTIGSLLVSTCSKAE